MNYLAPITLTLNRILPVNDPKHASNRTIEVRRAFGRSALFDFDEVCGQALGPAEYIAITKYVVWHSLAGMNSRTSIFFQSNFDTIYVCGVPVMSHENKDRARRFITLIDELVQSTRKDHLWLFFVTDSSL
jgi:cell division protein ZapE